MMEQWYALHTKPNYEYSVAAILQRRGFELYLPQRTQILETGGRKRTPFFPTYLFTRIDIQSTHSSQWEWTPGLRSIVHFGGRPTPVPDEVITFIQQKLSEMEDTPSSPAFKRGDLVRIISGPFRDMTAIFEGSSTPGMRVQVLLSAMGHATRLHLDADQLQMAESEKVTGTGRRERRTRGHGRSIKGAS
jgi:transcriptional antiterminator RfaH